MANKDVKKLDRGIRIIPVVPEEKFKIEVKKIRNEFDLEEIILGDK